MITRQQAEHANTPVFSVLAQPGLPLSTRLALFVSTAGLVGLVPVAPGTFGSIAGLGLVLLLREVAPVAIDAVSIPATLVLGVWAAGVTEAALGRSDPGAVVIDEVLGILITMAGLPASGWTLLWGFLLFRLFDITKPFPVRRLERASGGLGVMLDDAMAGVYAHLALRAWLAYAPFGVTW